LFSSWHCVESLEGEHDPRHRVSRRADDKALGWIRKAETSEDVDPETPGPGWVTLDRKLAAALTYISPGELGRQLTLTSSAALNQGRVARGRLLRSQVFQYYSSGKNAEFIYGSNHILEISLRGENLESFHNSWTMTGFEAVETTA
jgi:hypothetical protein